MGRWQNSCGFFGSSSSATEVDSFTPAGIKTTAPLLQAQEISLGFAVPTKLRAGENRVQGMMGFVREKVGFKPIGDRERKQSTA